MVFDADTIIAGGGLAGLCTAAALSRRGLTVVIVDPAPPVTEAEAPGADLRTTALLQPSQAFLDEIGLWDSLAPDATPLEVMAIVDDGSPPLHRAFEAKDISDLPFGWNLPNWLIRKEILAVLDADPRVTLRLGVGVEKSFARTVGARVTLTNGERLSAPLIIAADGRDSPLRTAAGIGTWTHRFGQSALSFAVTHPEPHGNVSTEVHRSGGPFTLVPLPDRNGLPCSAVVWMEPHAKARGLAEMPEDDFSAAATERSLGIIGPLTLASPRSLYPIITRTAERFSAERLALVAEAAHAVPPIGAQGLNMSLADIAELYRLITPDTSDPGDPGLLARYDRRRRADVTFRAAGISLLNHISMAGSGPLQALRGPGLKLLHDVKPVRTSLMRLGMGALG